MCHHCDASQFTLITTSLLQEGFNDCNTIIVPSERKTSYGKGVEMVGLLRLRATQKIFEILVIHV